MSNAINDLEKLYLCVFNDRKTVKKYLEVEALAPLYITVQQKILKVTVQNHLCQIYPPPLSFKKMFLRLFLDTVESYGSECSEELLKEYTEMLSVSFEEQISYRSYLLGQDCIITLQENSCFVAKSTTGLQTWEASKYLSEWCMKNPSKFRNKRVLELGSGIGLLGISVIKLCHPKKYIFTDKSWEVLNILSSNIKINIPKLENQDVELNPLVWTTACDTDASNLTSDIILGADLVYDATMVESLVHALKTFIIKDLNCAYIASTIRDLDTDKKFLHHLGLSGLSYEKLESHEKAAFIYNPTSLYVLYKITVRNN